MAPDRSFDELMARLRASDDAAASEVFHRFADRLIGLAHTRLDALLRQKVGAEDVVQSVFRSFFRRQANGQFDLESWDNLWGLLVVLTLRKCSRKIRHFRGPGHDVQREVSAPAVNDSGTGWHALAREPIPEEAAILAETLDQLMSVLKERERQVLELRLQGFTVPEISARVGRTEFTVEGILKRIRERLRARIDGMGSD